MTGCFFGRQVWRAPALLAGCVTLVVLSACAPPVRGVPPAAILPTRPAIAVPETVLVRVAGRPTRIPLDDYVLGAVLAEVTPLNETPAVVAKIYDVQAIIARTYAVSQLGRHRTDGFDLCDSTHCQLYDPARIRTSRFAADARAAVTRTHGQVLAYEGRVVEALFHADCGGHTASAEDVWGGARVPYLRSVEDDLPAETHRPWELSATSEQVRKALDADQRTDVGRTLRDIEIVSRDESGRAAGLDLRGERSLTVKGDVLRAVLNRTFGERAVQSTLFTVSKKGSTFTFRGTGFGHGVGLCQRGAAARARRGDSVAEILGAYFRGAQRVVGRRS